MHPSIHGAGGFIEASNRQLGSESRAHLLVSGLGVRNLIVDDGVIAPVGVLEGPEELVQGVLHLAIRVDVAVGVRSMAELDNNKATGCEG
jgi:hypothetical protein